MQPDYTPENAPTDDPQALETVNYGAGYALLRPDRTPRVSGRGGFRPGSRLATLLDEIRCEAMAARLSNGTLERDRAFSEIERLAVMCAKLVEDNMLVWGRTPPTRRPRRPALQVLRTEQ